MGRKPNPIISEYFTRGPKLSDSSNRYPHTCKLCGENFPKGRQEVLYKHITDKCPAITPEDRINATLGFAGLSSAGKSQKPINLNTGPLSNLRAGPVSDAPDTWSALRTLAEASRQVGANEIAPSTSNEQQAPVPAAQQTGSRDQNHENTFDAQNQFTVDDNTDPSLEANQGQERKHDAEAHNLSLFQPEENLEHLQAVTRDAPAPPTDSSGLAVAAAATARLSHPFVHENPQELSQPEPMDTAPDPASTASRESQAHEQPPPPPQQPQPQHPWGEMSYVDISVHVPAAPRPMTPVRGGTRMSIGNGVRSEHKRKAYSPSRRQEVKEARKKGACIRCRILRKTCGLNDPCDQCRKIHGPRHWTYPCVRTQLNQVLSLYSAGLIVVLAQNRVNQARSTFRMIQNDTKLRACLWEDSVPMSLAALVTPQEDQPMAEDAGESQGSDVSLQVAMIDQEKEDLPARMEEYLQEMLPLLIEREPSHFIRVVLDFAQKAEHRTGDLVKRAIDLWGLIEILDRERSWWIFEERGDELVPRGPDGVAAADTNVDAEQDFYSLITWQLSAAAERKANNVSQKLVGELQRCLENGKVTPHFDVYLAILILLHCVEKTTWTVKVWEMEEFRQRWPLERPPSAFTHQGHQLAELLKMLLTLRKAHPKTFRAPGGELAATEANEPVVSEFFSALNLQYDEVVDRLQNCAFSPESSRSLELHFSGLVLLPQGEGEGRHASYNSPATTPHHDGSLDTKPESSFSSIA